MCTKPTCIDGCPVGIDIPRFIRHLLVRDLDGARAVINESNLFPSVCGRVCPQESQCEAQCQVGRNKKTPMESVAIGRLERFIGDNAPPAKYVPPNDRQEAGQGGDRRLRPVGARGGGGSRALRRRAHGLRGAARRRRRAAVRHPVVPLPREIIAREVDTLKAMGVAFETNKVVGKTFSIRS
jgi:glutamate synthase (NADPH) small chain